MEAGRGRAIAATNALWAQVGLVLHPLLFGLRANYPSTGQVPRKYRELFTSNGISYTHTKVECAYGGGQRTVPYRPPAIAGRMSLWRLSQSPSPHKYRYHLGFGLVIQHF